MALGWGLSGSSLKSGVDKVMARGPDLAPPPRFVKSGLYIL